MRILLTNDDGIHAKVCACWNAFARAAFRTTSGLLPLKQTRSGLAHSLTLSDPLRLRQISEKHFAVRGTPTDCVIMGIGHVLKQKPDLILSGVNAGSNLADDVTYSGTIAAAIEGHFIGVRSIALSASLSARGWRAADTLGGCREACG